MKPKLIDKWKDTGEDITNHWYQYENGCSLVVAINPRTVDFNFSVVIKGGSSFEPQLGVPFGTAHFLEHILYEAPNRLCKNLDEMQGYKYGNKSRPGFSANASTDKRWVFYYAHGHEKAAERMVKYTLAKIDITGTLNKEEIEKQRNIITNEINRKLKEERDSGLQYDRKFISPVYPEFHHRVVGTVESINEIDSDHLSEFMRATHTPKNTVVTIQSAKMPGKGLMRIIDNFAQSLSNSETEVKERILPFDPGFQYGHFHDGDLTSVQFYLTYFGKTQRKLDYRLDRLLVLLKPLLWRLGQAYLRDEKHLSYTLEPFSSRYPIDNLQKGFSLKTEKKDLLLFLDEAYTMLFDYSKEFLESSMGQKWFTNLISDYIFQRNKEIDSEYAEDMGIGILDRDISDYKFEFKKAKAEMLKLTTKDLLDFFQEYIRKEPIFWFVSPHQEEEIMEIFKQSKFYKRFAK